MVSGSRGSSPTSTRIRSAVLLRSPLNSSPLVALCIGHLLVLHASRLLTRCCRQGSAGSRQWGVCGWNTASHVSLRVCRPVATGVHPTAQNELLLPAPLVPFPNSDVISQSCTARPVSEAPSGDPAGVSIVGRGASELFWQIATPRNHRVH